ncbi:hypothetical protein CALCODRAFT_135215 [Calocera cornea HHB12733]|uniref:Uncharacterized protein n=1 Tax=Calocera cornea HHB12733 TaxID=1353952 RepID=A0A165CV33_9BASI|nr:hypothetical protein CALCODRAFT_135215 [Calocera cornea HHB12733]
MRREAVSGACSWRSPVSCRLRGLGMHCGESGCSIHFCRRVLFQVPGVIMIIPFRHVLHCRGTCQATCFRVLLPVKQVAAFGPRTERSNGLLERRVQPKSYPDRKQSFAVRQRGNEGGTLTTHRVSDVSRGVILPPAHSPATQ